MRPLAVQAKSTPQQLFNLASPFIHAHVSPGIIKFTSLLQGKKETSNKFAGTWKRKKVQKGSQNSFIKTTSFQIHPIFPSRKSFIQGTGRNHFYPSKYLVIYSSNFQDTSAFLHLIENTGDKLAKLIYSGPFLFRTTPSTSGRIVLHTAHI